VRTPLMVEKPGEAASVMSTGRPVIEEIGQLAV
jgi:hypothetical protein